jgi:Tol biopolymer transport system component
MKKPRHVLATIGGAIVIVSAFTAPSRVQKYSEWSTPINLGATVNSTAMDRAPAVSKDGLSLYFSSNRLGSVGMSEDIYVSQRETRDGEWGPPTNLGPIINTTLSEQVPALSRDGHLLFFASNRTLGGFGGLDIWVSRREDTHDDFAWQAPENLGPGVNSASIDAGPSYFENDDVGVPQLYFQSNRLGGPGISNFYVSEQMADGSFGPAVLISELSVGDSSRASIRHDGREIFFNSNRPGSIADSFDISSDGETLYFASNRPAGGPTDIYMSIT